MVIPTLTLTPYLRNITVFDERNHIVIVTSWIVRMFFQGSSSTTRKLAFLPLFQYSALAFLPLCSACRQWADLAWLRSSSQSRLVTASLPSLWIIIGIWKWPGYQDIDNTQANTSTENCWPWISLVSPQPTNTHSGWEPYLGSNEYCVGCHVSSTFTWQHTIHQHTSTLYTYYLTTLSHTMYEYTLHNLHMVSCISIVFTMPPVLAYYLFSFAPSVVMPVWRHAPLACMHVGDIRVCYYF